MSCPSEDEIKAMVDIVNQTAVDHVLKHTPETLEAAMLARRTLHAGIALVFAQLQRDRQHSATPIIPQPKPVRRDDRRKP